MRLTVYADFANPYCYLASRRADALRTAGVEVDWRTVEQRPHLPVGGLRSPAQVAGLARHLREVAGLLVEGESLPGDAPAFVPRTEAAVSAYAEAYGAGVADDVRRLLFELYWRDGVDIGNPNAVRTPLTGAILRGNSPADPLRLSGFAVSVDRGPITTAAWRRIRAWREEWRQLGAAELPVLLDGSGLRLSGEAAVRRLVKEIAHAGAPVEVDLPDPRRYPDEVVRPPLGWATETGGRWRFAGRAAGTAVAR